MKLPRLSFALAVVALSFGSLREARADLNVTGVLPAYGNDIQVNPVTNRIYIATPEGNVAVADGATNAVLDTITLPDTVPQWVRLAVDPTVNRIYAATYKQVVLLDGSTHQILAAHPLGFSGYPVPIAVNPATHKVYLANNMITPTGPSIPGKVLVLDGESLDEIATVTVGYNPQSIAVDSGLNRIYVGGASPLFVLDGDRNTVETLSSGEQYALVDPRSHDVYLFSYDQMSLLRDGEQQSLPLVQSKVKAMAISPGGRGIVRIVYREPSYTDDESPYDYSSWTVDRFVFPSDTPPIDTRPYTMAISRSDTLRSGGFTALGVNPATGKIYVSEGGSGETLVLEDGPPVDTTPPTVTGVTLEGEPNAAGWYKERTPVTLQTQDNEGGLGVHYIRYETTCCNGIPPNGLHHFTHFEDTLETTMGPYRSSEPESKISYLVRDYAGNSVEGEIIVKIDGNPPSTSARVESLPDGTRVTLSAKDDRSGVKETLYQVNDGPILPYTGPITMNPARGHTVKFHSRDIADNEEGEKTLRVFRSGDLNDNGEVTISDAVLILQAVISPDKVHSASFVAAGDLDGSGKLEVTDAVLLLRQLVGI